IILPHHARPRHSRVELIGRATGEPLHRTRARDRIVLAEVDVEVASGTLRAPYHALPRDRDIEAAARKLSDAALWASPQLVDEAHVQDRGVTAERPPGGANVRRGDRCEGLDRAHQCGIAAIRETRAGQNGEAGGVLLAPPQPRTAHDRVE